MFNTYFFMFSKESIENSTDEQKLWVLGRFCVKKEMYKQKSAGFCWVGLIALKGSPAHCEASYPASLTGNKEKKSLFLKI